MKSNMRLRPFSLVSLSVNSGFVAVLAAVLTSACGGGNSSSNDGSAGTGGATGTGGSSGTGGTRVDGGGGDAIKLTGTLGATCTTNADCGNGGLTCMAATDKVVNGVGGPAHGYCTAACTDTASATACAGLSGVCVNFAATGQPSNSFCMSTCTYGSTVGAGTKCNNRPDVACFRLMSSTGAVQPACLPTCSQDSDCPTGRKCDATIAQCVDMPSAGLPLGSHCTYDPMKTMPKMCAGGCLGVGSTGNITASFCTQSCVVGQLNNCNWVDKGMSLASGGSHGVCFPTNSTAGTGDQGVCLQLCDAVSDCADQTDPGLTCDMTNVDVIGHGVCIWSAPATDGGVGDSATGQ